MIALLGNAHAEAGGEEVAQAVRVFGGPETATLLGATEDEGLSLAALVSRAAEGNREAYAEPSVLHEEGALMLSSGPLQGLLVSGGGLLTYIVERGDTLSQIARGFGVSLDTIIAANEDLRVSRIYPGQKILVPPVSGALHAVERDETMESIAAFYGIPLAHLTEANPTILPIALQEGDLLVVPGVKPQRIRSVRMQAANLPDLRSYFKIPTSGFNWGTLHPENAVDIANACGTPVYAAAEGLAVHIGSPQQWNGGYGGFVELEHPNGTGTTYAHLGEVVIEEGSYVRQKEQIGMIGNTGNTHGATGCHLHFEVAGAKNPFAR